MRPKYTAFKLAAVSLPTYIRQQHWASRATYFTQPQITVHSELKTLFRSLE